MGLYSGGGGYIWNEVSVGTCGGLIHGGGGGASEVYGTSIIYTNLQSVLTYKNQSTTNIGPILSIGSPTASNTITKLVSPGLGIPAAPIDTTVQISLKGFDNVEITHARVMAKPFVIRHMNNWSIFTLLGDDVMSVENIIWDYIHSHI